QTADLVVQGRQALDADRPDDAIALLEKAVAADPKSPAALAWLGSAQVRKAARVGGMEAAGWVKRGFDTLDEAVERFPDAVVVYAKLALRNVFRNRRRTLITLAAMGFGAAAIIVFGGFVHSIYYGVRESTIRSQVGHIQIYRRGYSEKGNLAPFDYLIADYPALRDELRRIEHVKMVTARLGFSGLVSTGDTT